MEQDERDYEQEYKEFTKKLERELAKINKDSNRRFRIYIIIMAAVLVTILASIIMLLIPATETLALRVSGGCNILISFLLFLQFTQSYKWSKFWSFVLLVVCVWNMYLGITKFI